MATIWQRGPNQFCARVRRNGQSVTKTFESKANAQAWARITEGKVTGDEYIDRRVARKTTLGEAIRWFVRDVLPDKPKSLKTRTSQANYWLNSEYATWSLLALKPTNLLAWRRKALDEDNAEDGEPVGPDTEFSPQTCIHRLVFLQNLYSAWPLHFGVPLENPVIKGVRPRLDNHRKRRLDAALDRNGLTEEDRLYQVVDKSKSPWLGAAARIAVETAIRQAEMVSLTRNNIHLDGDHPRLYLPKTKNDKERTVPLSPEAIEAFRKLIPTDAPRNSKARVLPIETPRAIGHAFRAAVTDEDFPDLRWHDLRHEAISRLFENPKLRDQEIIAIAGHLSARTLARYTHIRAGSLAGVLAEHSEKKKADRAKRHKAWQASQRRPSAA
ncbi:MAG: site-specific integrase [Rhodospirillaceae bacterium]|nr:site-specific integrase [Rhodospirillaceae bacterium]